MELQYSTHTEAFVGNVFLTNNHQEGLEELKRGALSILFQTDEYKVG